MFHTVDGSEIRRSPVEVGRFSCYLRRVFIHCRVVALGFGISSINMCVIHPGGECNPGWMRVDPKDTHHIHINTVQVDRMNHPKEQL